MKPRRQSESHWRRPSLPRSAKEIMHSIPDDLDLSRLVGQQLQQICIGAYDLQFRFMGEDRIRCTGIVTVELNGNTKEVFGNDLWKDPRPLTEIVGRNVTAWKKESSHVLAILLEDAATIRFISEDSPYEGRGSASERRRRN